MTGTSTRSSVDGSHPASKPGHHDDRWMVPQPPQPTLAFSRGATTQRLSARVLSVLDRNLDVDAGRKVEPLKGVDRLGAVLDDVDEALVDAHLEVLAAVLVLVR